MMSLLMLLAVAAAPAAEAAAPDPAAAPAERGVIAYPPAFFAAASPTSAYDMVTRLPGFTFELRRGARMRPGNAATASRRVAKNDTLDEIPKRIPTAAVAHRADPRRGASTCRVSRATSCATSGFRAASPASTSSTTTGADQLRAEAHGSGRAVACRCHRSWQGPERELGDGKRVRYRAGGAVRLRPTSTPTPAGSD